MEVYFIGCRAASEAVENFMHTAFAFQINGVIYWFDAGEGCSYTAHLMGIDLLKIKEIFISHPHMDHVGGLCNLIWTVSKLIKLKSPPVLRKSIGLHIGDLMTWEGARKILKGNHGYESYVGVLAYQIEEGHIYKDENISVSAKGNGHMEKKETDKKLSFSFEIYCEGKRIIYSGDVKGLSDLDELLDKPCDYLFIESGHQSVEEICAYTNEKNIGTTVFLHHRRDVIEDIQKARMTAQRLSKCRVYFAQDKDKITI